jgi:very-short-patch-repair endonuclease
MIAMSSYRGQSRREPPAIDAFKFCDICGDEIYASSPNFRICWKCQPGVPEELATPHLDKPLSWSANLKRLRRVVDARQWLLPHCESPIEVVLGAWLFALMQEHVLAPYRPHMCLGSDAQMRLATEMLLIPQYRWMRYRIDLTLRVPTKPRRIVFIECDGKEFHRATQQQMALDRGRQQEITDAGYPFFRFSGREINRNPEVCAWSVLAPELSRLQEEAGP